MAPYVSRDEKEAFKIDNFRLQKNYFKKFENISKNIKSQKNFISNGVCVGSGRTVAAALYAVYGICDGGVTSYSGLCCYSVQHSFHGVTLALVVTGL